MCKPISLLAVLLLACGSAQAEKRLLAPAETPAPIKQADGPTIGYASVAEALAALKREPNAREMFSGDGTVIQVGKLGQPNYALWTFVSPSHPAYPSAVKRTIYPRNGQVVIDMDIACEAATPKCEQLVRDFQTLNDGMLKALNSQTKR